MSRHIWSSLLAISIAIVCEATSSGHATGESYIWLNPQSDRLDGQVELRLADVRECLGIEIPEEYEEAKQVVLANADQLEAYIQRHFKIEKSIGEPIPYKRVKVDLMESDYFGHFAQYFFETEILEEVPLEIVVSSTLLFECDQFSRSLLHTEYNHFTGKTHPENFCYAVFSPWNATTDVDFNNLTQIRTGRKYFIWEGIRHIWIGIDHILFLVTLLLASVLVRREIEPETPTNATNSSGQPSSPEKRRRFEWLPVEGFRGALWSIFKIVTIFTIAHSITLCLASLNIISLPSRLVESIIALSIVLVALNNIMPRFHDRTWIILFLFGLFHGLGFASVMQNLPFRMSNLTRLLVCFNIGVELGQLVIVAAIFPLIFMMRKSKYYKPVFLVGCSVLMCVIAGYWFIERAFGWA